MQITVLNTLATLSKRKLIVIIICLGQVSILLLKVDQIYTSLAKFALIRTSS